MTTTTVTAERAATNSPAWGHLLLWAALWLGVIQQLSIEWSINPQYTYGWGVPFLTAYLFWQRWKFRPEPQPAEVNWLPAIGGGVLLALFFPIVLVQEANPDWRLVSWAFTFVAVGLTWLLLWYHGGKVWWQHFAIAAAFPLVAVPWPSVLEVNFIQWLMRTVAAITVEAVNWYGIPAMQRGNLIHLPNGVVGVDEACSGVRSFQATFMAAIFFGELNRFPWQRRLALIGSGIGLAMFLNVARTFTLTLVSAKQGTAALGRWHDPAGYAVMVLAFAGLWALSLWLGRAVKLPETETEMTAPVRKLSRAWVLGSLIWLAVAYGATELWYRAHERSLTPQATWTVRWPEESEQFKFKPISEEVKLILRYSEGQSGTWSHPNAELLTYYFRWEPGRVAAQLARSHSPEVCLPATGLVQKGGIGTLVVEVGNLKLPFRTYLFELQGRPLHVYFCLWEERLENQQSDLGELSRQSRWDAVKEGRRHLGQQVLEVAIAGPTSAREAQRLLKVHLQQFIIPGKTASTAVQAALPSAPALGVITGLPVAAQTDTVSGVAP